MGDRDHGHGRNSPQGLAYLEGRVRSVSAEWEEGVLRCTLDDASLAAQAGQLPAPAEYDVPLISQRESSL